MKFHLQVINKIDLLDTWEPKDFEAFARQSYIWDNGEYGRALRRMKSGLGAEQLKLIFFEDMRLRPRDVLSEIENFLGISTHEYSEKLLNTRVNESASRPMPEFFPGLFGEDVERIIREVEAEGLTAPEAWTTP